MTAARSIFTLQQKLGAQPQKFQYSGLKFPEFPPSLQTFLILLSGTRPCFMKARFAILLLILALPLAALGFTFFSDNLLDRPERVSAVARAETAAPSPAFAPPPAEADTASGLTVRPELDATPWNIFAGTAALGLILLLRRL